MTATPGTLEERLRHFSLFLRGEAAINGAWFGDNADGERGKFWWRKYLPLTEAADEIASLRARVEVLEGALTEIAEARWPDTPEIYPEVKASRGIDRVQAFARQALKDAPDAE